MLGCCCPPPENHSWSEPGDPVLAPEVAAATLEGGAMGDGPIGDTGVPAAIEVSGPVSRAFRAEQRQSVLFQLTIKYLEIIVCSE